ncbi:MAG: hypothetical protein HRT74_11435 [Flavobacteriales bacterium]|nr:hypothetical protein [Flavobacteriales bacterium]
MATISGQSIEDLHMNYQKILSSEPGEISSVVLLSQFGAFTETKTETIVKLVEQIVLERGSKRRVMKRVGSVLIEALQNAQIHGAHTDNNLPSSFLVLKESKDLFHLHIGNLILAEDANLIDYKISQLNALDKNELRKLYIETLCNENFSYKGGAGLGFLTIAKKAADKVEYHVQQLNDSFAFFTVEIKVSR